MKYIGSNKTQKAFIRRGNIGDKAGWCFEIYSGDRKFSNFISGLYKKSSEARKQAKRYLRDGTFDLYGSAETEAKL